MRACRANLSPVWGLSLAAGLSSLCELPGPPVAARHRRRGRAPSPVADRPARRRRGDRVGRRVVARRHRRRPPSLRDRARLPRRATRRRVGTRPARSAHGVHRGAGRRAAHRTSDPSPRLGPAPERRPRRGAVAVLRRVRRGTGVGCVDAPGAHGRRRLARARRTRPDLALLRPRMDARAVPRRRFTDETTLDSSRLAAALDALPDHDIAYQHGIDAVVAAVEKGDAQAGFLLRPATVTQIAAAAAPAGGCPPRRRSSIRSPVPDWCSGA